MIASASGSQLASYAWGAANVIFVVGAQKLVATLDDATRADLRAQLEARGRSRACRLRAEQRRRKILEIHQEQPGRVHVVLIRQSVGF